MLNMPALGISAPPYLSMQMKRVQDIKRALDQVAPAIFNETPVLFAYLYGSYAQGAVHPFSDLDIAIYVEGLDKKSCLDLELSLGLLLDEKLDHRVQSDVRVVNHLPLVVKGEILAVGELIYSRAEYQRIEFETQVRRVYFDFLPVVQRYRNAYRKKLLGVQANGLR
jgi:predicted nucleotidyltransferase